LLGEDKGDKTKSGQLVRFDFPFPVFGDAPDAVLDRDDQYSPLFELIDQGGRQLGGTGGDENTVVAVPRLSQNGGVGQLYRRIADMRFGQIGTAVFDQ